MVDLSCKFCGGGKFIRFSTWMECWHCGSEYERPVSPSTTVLLPKALELSQPLFPYNFGATYFTPHYSEQGRFRRTGRHYDYASEQEVDDVF